MHVCVEITTKNIYCDFCIGKIPKKCKVTDTFHLGTGDGAEAGGFGSLINLRLHHEKLWKTKKNGERKSMERWQRRKEKKERK